MILVRSWASFRLVTVLFWLLLRRHVCDITFFDVLPSDQVVSIVQNASSAQLARIHVARTVHITLAYEHVLACAWDIMIVIYENTALHMQKLKSQA